MSFPRILTGSVSKRILKRDALFLNINLIIWHYKNDSHLGIQKDLKLQRNLNPLKEIPLIQPTPCVAF